jgi:putative nucleotidyltransferase with HDIG domain
MIIPLVSDKKQIGILGIARKTAFTRLEERLVAAIADMSANAIRRDALFRDLQKSTDELSRAYDITLAGWAKALELRDKETEGHSRRVTEITVRLARKMGFSEAEITQVRRGALLHDIGKMGIPDAILHKPGPLTEEEWEIMRMHPVYAYELLKEIDFLAPALEIPYSHHERWDGSGYPRGLKGEEIPLSARIFAVVDVWDALLSDRPYRPAWPEEKVLAYLWEQAGTHFDPEVVRLFQELITEKESLAVLEAPAD